MKVEIIPSLSSYEPEIHPEDTPEDWGREKPKEKKQVSFVYDTIRAETLKSLEPVFVPKPPPQQALTYAFPVIPLILAVVGVLVFLLFLKFLMR